MKINGYLRAIAVNNVARHSLRTVNRPMLTSGAPEGYLQIGETALAVTLDRCVDQRVAMFEKAENLAVVLQKISDRHISAIEVLVGLIAPRVMNCAAVENETAAITRLIFG